MFCFRERFENVLNSIRFQSLPGLYDPTTGLESGRLVDHLGLARSATQQLKDRFRNLIRLGRHRRTGCKQNLIFGEFTHTDSAWVRFSLATRKFLRFDSRAFFWKEPMFARSSLTCSIASSIMLIASCAPTEVVTSRSARLR